MANNNNNKKPSAYIVKNRSASKVVYRIPEANIRREFAPGESKKISFKELEQLSYQAGGREIMENFLQITDESVTESLNIATEAEYYMNEQQIIDLIKNGSNDAFLDCLDFAPIGVIDLIKEFAVKLPMTDLNKVQILREKTGFDVEKALANAAADKEPDEADTPAAETSVKKNTTPGRRTTPNYKVVNKKTAE